MSVAVPSVLPMPSMFGAAQEGGGTALVVETVDPAGDLVAGSCAAFRVPDDPDSSDTVRDGEAGDAELGVDGEVGLIVPEGVAWVGVELVEPPPGFVPAGFPYLDRVDLLADDPAMARFRVMPQGDYVATVQALAAATRGCELVEWYPGYPGYRGCVTGLDGIGDHACLADLQAANPGFDRLAEDRKNLAAVWRIGLAGGPADWTWENWMAIEAARGLPITFYSCAIQAAAQRAEPLGVRIAPNDLRLRIGSYGTTVAIDALFSPFAPGGQAARALFPYDHDLRAAVGMGNPSRRLNAAQVWDGYLATRDALTGGAWLDPQLATAALLTLGGYAPTPQAAVPEDQIFLMRVGLDAIARGTMDPTSAQVVSGVYDAWESAWYSEWLSSPPAQRRSFAEWLNGSGNLSATP